MTTHQPIDPTPDPVPPRRRLGTRLLRATLGLALLCSACAGRDTVADMSRADASALNPAASRADIDHRPDGISLAVRHADPAWRMPRSVVAVEVHVLNASEWDIQIRREDFALVDSDGVHRVPLSPFQVSRHQAQIEPAPAPRSAGFRTAPSPALPAPDLHAFQLADRFTPIPPGGQGPPASSPAPRATHVRPVHPPRVGYVPGQFVQHGPGLWIGTTHGRWDVRTGWSPWHGGWGPCGYHSCVAPSVGYTTSYRRIATGHPTPTGVRPPPPAPLAAADFGQIGPAAIALPDRAVPPAHQVSGLLYFEASDRRRQGTLVWSPRSWRSPLEQLPLQVTLPRR